MRVGWRSALAGLVAVGVAYVAPSSARACSPGQATPFALPRSGTTNVSTATSLTIFSRGVPWGLSLVAGGQDVPLGAPLRIGAGDGGMDVWRVQAATSDSMLIGGAEHVLSQAASGGSGAVELTRFTTATGYDKQQGVAPVLRAVHLWRVRYPVADINSGNCVFAEYHGFITVDYDPATVPNTAPSSVVHTFHLAPQNGGSEQTFVYAGDTPFTGLEPTGAYPLPIGAWQPELDPTRRYCLGISAFGDGDIARLPLASQQVCTDIAQLSAAGAPPSPMIGGGATGGGGGGCAVGGSGRPTITSLALVALVIALRRRRQVSLTSRPVAAER